MEIQQILRKLEKGDMNPFTSRYGRYIYTSHYLRCRSTSHSSTACLLTASFPVHESKSVECSQVAYVATIAITTTNKAAETVVDADDVAGSAVWVASLAMLDTAAVRL